MITDRISLPILFFLFSCVWLVTVRAFRTWWRLRHIPGPVVAGITNLQRAAWTTTKKAHLILQEQHAKYGEVVRIGPNMVSFSNPDAIPTVYPTKPGFPKSDFYVTLRPYTRGGGALHAVFNTTDETLHKQIKSPIAPMFSMTNTSSFEVLVDDVLQCLGEKLDIRFAMSGQSFNFGQYLQFFAFDVMGTLTFSKRYGFLDTGTDVRGMLQTIVDFMRGAAPMTQMPTIDWALRKNVIGDFFQRLLYPTASLSIMGFVAEAIKEKREKLTKIESEKEKSKDTRKDFLTRFIEIQRSNPNIPAWAPTAWTFSNVIAGSDSVGSIMRTAFYHLLTNPSTLSRLTSELLASNLSTPNPRFSEVRDLPYLDACVQEASRMHPPFALPFERVVPEGGVTVLGYYLPAGTVVGGSPYVVGRHQGTFGKDAEIWRPERWLEGDTAHKKKLDQGVLTYGAGRRVCLGRHIGILEIKKLISFLLVTYDIQIKDQEKWSLENSWFFFQTGLFANISKRSSDEAMPETGPKVEIESASTQ